MKHKIIGVAGIAISILIALWESLEVLYNYVRYGYKYHHLCDTEEAFSRVRIKFDNSKRHEY